MWQFPASEGMIPVMVVSAKPMRISHSPMSDVRWYGAGAGAALRNKKSGGGQEGNIHVVYILFIYLSIYLSI